MMILPRQEMRQFSPEDQEFIDRAVEACQRMGEAAALLLIGSQAAGFASSWSDLDLWILGDKAQLSNEERQTYERSGQLFVDRGNLEAHWTFYDTDDLAELLSIWRHDEKIWLLATSRILYGSSEKVVTMRDRFSSYPTEVAERKLKWFFGKYCLSLGPLNTAARGMPIVAFMVAGQIIQYLAKISCLADKKPFPYAKWLVKEAQKTYLGQKLYPFMEKAVLGIEDFVHPPAGKHFRELTPLKELRATKEIVQSGLKALGWSCDWIDNTDIAVEAALRESRPELI